MTCTISSSPLGAPIGSLDIYISQLGPSPLAMISSTVHSTEVKGAQCYHSHWIPPVPIDQQQGAISLLNP